MIIIDRFFFIMWAENVAIALVFFFDIHPYEKELNSTLKYCLQNLICVFSFFTLLEHLRLPRPKSFFCKKMSFNFFSHFFGEKWGWIKKMKSHFFAQYYLKNEVHIRVEKMRTQKWDLIFWPQNGIQIGVKKWGSILSKVNRPSGCCLIFLFWLYLCTQQ